MNAHREAPTRAAAVAAALLAALAAGGCGEQLVTDTPRTATEQLLVAASIDQAVAQLDFSPVENRKVYVDTSHVERIDETFLDAAVRARAWYEGALVMAAPEEADYILEVRSGAVGVDRSDYIFGIPASNVPTPFGNAPLPEVAAYKSIKQAGVTRISLVAYRRDDRRFLYASGPAFGFSNEHAWWLFGGGPVTKGNVRPPRREANTADVIAPPAVAPEAADLEAEVETQPD